MPEAQVPRQLPIDPSQDLPSLDVDPDEVVADPATATGTSPEQTPDTTPDTAPETGSETSSVQEASEPVDWEAMADQDGRTSAQLLQALSATESGRDEYLDSLRRKQAEFDNFRKRTMRDSTKQRVAGHAEVVQRLLEVLDDFDRALTSMDEVDPATAQGLALVREKLTSVLADFGLERVDDVGATFDPTRHEAVGQVEGDTDEPIVAQVLRPGYLLGDRVLRAAMVLVAQ